MRLNTLWRRRPVTNATTPCSNNSNFPKQCALVRDATTRCREIDVFDSIHSNNSNFPMVRAMPPHGAEKLMYSKRSTCAALHLRAAATKFCTTFTRKSLDVREFFCTEPLLHLEKLLPKLYRTTCR